MIPKLSGLTMGKVRTNSFSNNEYILTKQDLYTVIKFDLVMWNNICTVMKFAVVMWNKICTVHKFYVVMRKNRCKLYPSYHKSCYSIII